MVHKSSIIPGISKFIDENVLAHYPANSMKRILMAGAVSLYLKQNEGIIDSLTNNSLVSGLGIVKDGGMVDLEPLRDVFRSEINKAGFMRLTFPILGDVDFTPEDIDALYKFITEANTQITSPMNVLTTSTTPILGSGNGGVY